MKKVNVSKIMVLIAIFAIICCISTVNFATDVNNLIQQIDERPGNNTPDTNEGNKLPENLTPIGGTNTANTNSTSLPKTGVDDTMMWVLIGVSAVAAIYTYKKVRDYDV